MHRIPTLLPILCAAVLCGMPAEAAQQRLPDVAALTTPLGCTIEDLKVVKITNTTGGTLPAGTRITYDWVRMPDYAHITATVTGGPLAPGAFVRVGVGESYSCTAWTPRVLVMAP